MDKLNSPHKKYDFAEKEFEDITYQTTEEYLHAILNELKKMNRKQDTITGILKFWYVLTIIGLIIGFGVYIAVYLY